MNTANALLVIFHSLYNRFVWTLLPTSTEKRSNFPFSELSTCFTSSHHGQVAADDVDEDQAKLAAAAAISIVGLANFSNWNHQARALGTAVQTQCKRIRRKVARLMLIKMRHLNAIVEMLQTSSSDESQQQRKKRTAETELLYYMWKSTLKQRRERPEQSRLTWQKIDSIFFLFQDFTDEIARIVLQLKFSMGWKKGGEENERVAQNKI